jgi:hypothetical protein
MSRFLKVMIVLLTIAAFAAPAFATDLSIGGQMRAEGFYDDLDSAADPTMNWDQRFRINTVFQVSDEVKAVLRMDLGETEWGSVGQNSVRNSISRSWASQIDKAYLQIDKDMFTLSAGQQYFGSPNALLVDHVGTGLIFKLNTPVTVKVQFTKMDENGSFSDSDVAVPAGGSYEDLDEDATTAPTWVPTTATTTSADDTNLYSGEVGYSSDNFSVAGIFALLDDAATDANKNAYGIAGKFNAGGFALTAELDILGGDDGAGNDYTGTQFYLDANTDVSETLNVGGYLLYAAGDENDTVIYDVTNWSSFSPHYGGYVGQTVVAGKPIAGWGTEDRGNSGIMSAALYATFQANDDLGYKFQGEYATEEEDAMGDYDYYALTVSSKYKVATNTFFMADVMMEDSSSDAMGDNDSVSFWTQLQVNF